MAHIHTPGFIRAIQKRDDVKVKSVWDHDASRAGKRAGELQAGVVDDVAVVYADKDIDAVVICSETDRHEALMIPAAIAKKAIYAEKPLGMGAKDGHAIADAIDKSGVTFQTGYFMRGMPAHLFLKDRIDAGAFGKITRARFSNCHGGALGGWFDTEWRWMADPKQSGIGGFGDLGTHGLDILMWWFGDVADATAAIDNGTVRYPGCDELGEGLIRFKGGVIATLARAGTMSPIRSAPRCAAPRATPSSSTEKYIIKASTMPARTSRPNGSTFRRRSTRDSRRFSTRSPESLPSWSACATPRRGPRSWKQCTLPPGDNVRRSAITPTSNTRSTRSGPFFPHPPCR